VCDFKSARRFVILLSILLTVAMLLCLFATLLRSKREQRYIGLAARYATRYEIPLPLVLAVIRTESDFHPDAVSAAGAMGLMQLMPETFAYLRDERLDEALADNAAFDPEVNIRYGCYYLAYLFDRFDDWNTALAAYNAGESRVAEWLKNPEIAPDGRLEAIPFEETEEYIKKVTRAFDEYTKKYKE
jgi:soluble lytic murein transglycosylase